MMKNRNIWLLGGGGFLGRTLAESLCSDDMRVHIISQHILDNYRICKKTGGEPETSLES